VTPPPHIELKVIETDPGVRGDTATGGSKPAKMETGAMVRVPCSSTKAKCCASTRAPARYISRGKGDSETVRRCRVGKVGRGSVPTFPTRRAQHPSESDEDLRERSSRARRRLKRACFGLSRSSTPSSSRRAAAATRSPSSSRVAGDVAREGVHVLDQHGLAARGGGAAHTLADGDAHAGGLALERPQHQFATLI
jgi:hypothetical protein